MSLSDFARACGFARGFPGDVISGKRRLTAKSAFAFEQALKLPRVGKKLFRFLVAQKELDLYPEISRAHIADEIQNLRRLPWRQERRQLPEIASGKIKAVLSDSRAMSTYAACGEPKTGASYQELIRRTQFSAKELDQQLLELEKVNLVCREDGHFFPKDLHLFLEASEQSQLIRDVFQNASRVASMRSERADLSKEMFFVSHFCINEESLPELKVALRQMILKYVDESVNTSGDRVIKLVTGLHL